MSNRNKNINKVIIDNTKALQQENNELKKRIQELESLVKKSSTIHNVSDPFILCKDVNNIGTLYWSGKDWVIDQVECPKYNWEDAQKYSQFLGCRFTDPE